MRFIMLGLMAVLLLGLDAIAEKRIALVIGNSAYETNGWTLTNPVNDAELISTSLERVGFEVHQLLDADRNQMEEAFQDHADRLKEAGEDAVGFFFYAGPRQQDKTGSIFTSGFLNSSQQSTQQTNLSNMSNINHISWVRNSYNF